VKEAHRPSGRRGASRRWTVICFRLGRLLQACDLEGGEEETGGDVLPVLAAALPATDAVAAGKRSEIASSWASAEPSAPPLSSQSLSSGMQAWRCTTPPSRTARRRQMACNSLRDTRSRTRAVGVFRGWGCGWGWGWGGLGLLAAALARLWAEWRFKGTEADDMLAPPSDVRR
jgi:hypothetical protein